MQQKGQTTAFPTRDFACVTVRGPRKFDVWCESAQICIVEPSHGAMYGVRGMLKATEQPSSQGSDWGKWGPHGSVQRGTNERR